MAPPISSSRRGQNQIYVDLPGGLKQTLLKWFVCLKIGKVRYINIYSRYIAMEHRMEKVLWIAIILGLQLQLCFFAFGMWKK